MKMEIQDFRIGSIVKCKISNDPGIYQVMVLDGFHGRVMLSGGRRGEWIAVENIKPVKLNPEWQQRLGVRQLGMNKFEHLDTGFDLSSACEIKWVHQIQNIFFCASGNELTIKEKQAA